MDIRPEDWRFRPAKWAFSFKKTLGFCTRTRPTGPHPLRARELTTSHPEGLTTRLVPVEVDLKQQIFDVCSSLNNGHSPKGRLRQLCAKLGNRPSALAAAFYRGLLRLVVPNRA
jgi:hypothetical protein